MMQENVDIQLCHHLIGFKVEDEYLSNQFFSGIFLPIHVLIAIKTTEVGVETFSLTLKSKLRMLNEQISTPLPVMAEKMPPKNPVKVKTIMCQIPKLGMESKVLLLYSLMVRIFKMFEKYNFPPLKACCLFLSVSTVHRGLFWINLAHFLDNFRELKKAKK